MSATTAWRISKTPAFDAEYRAARRDAYWRTIARLQHATGAAASLILKLIASCEKIGPLQLRAASTVLELSWKGMQAEELAARIDRLEQTIK